MTEILQSLAGWSNFGLQAQAPMHTGGSTDVFSLMFNAGLVVQFVLFVLVLFSILTWAVILTKYKAIWDARHQNETFTNLFWQSGSLSHAYSQSKHFSASPLAAIFRLGYAELGKVMRFSESGGLSKAVMENLRRAMRRGKFAESTRLQRMVTFLATCANTAPFIGLFGTVWGIMDAFRAIGSTGAANLATVAPGIAEALIATATGLFAAIPAVVFFNHFNRRLEVLDSEMDAFVQDFLNLVERDLMRRHGPPVEAVSPAGPR